MLKATILTTIIGLFTAARTIPIWTSVLVILLLVSAERRHVNRYPHAGGRPRDSRSAMSAVCRRARSVGE
jgi:hypothetical protein